MSIQAIFNNDAINALPKIKEIISNAKEFEANQMKCRTIRECCNSDVAIANMTDSELESFQDDLIKIFKHFDWM